MAILQYMNPSLTGDQTKWSKADKIQYDRAKVASQAFKTAAEKKGLSVRVAPQLDLLRAEGVPGEVLKALQRPPALAEIFGAKELPEIVAEPQDQQERERDNCRDDLVLRHARGPQAYGQERRRLQQNTHVTRDDRPRIRATKHEQEQWVQQRQAEHDHHHEQRLV